MPPPGNETDGRLHIHKDTEAFDALGAALRGNGKLEVGGKERTIYRAIVLENHVGPDGQPLEARDVEFMPPT
ncbi:hypothetical protein HY409_04145 [Candidatus Gottesmanbacteria bacterium]|nr:hypothetical protein [Candidatus Gottesmanbacteria bacterium]